MCGCLEPVSSGYVTGLEELSPVKVTVLEMKIVSGYLSISQFRRVKQYNEVEAWRPPDKGAVELGLISDEVHALLVSIALRALLLTS
ncbi:hypothetical protein DY000_02022598 [Brassica cretica]|uniref:Uncharacterized protein n=1 Tax=Brassica cretica TaxID=69181 RepID=A0ABQ7EL46_BRACR|nr:hypothetical protein DY000_02022598 [Brassica cretica]